MCGCSCCDPCWCWCYRPRFTPRPRIIRPIIIEPVLIPAPRDKWAELARRARYMPRPAVENFTL